MYTKHRAIDSHVDGYVDRHVTIYMVHRMIENVMSYQWYKLLSIIYFLEGSNSNKKQRNECRFLVLVDWGCVHCTQRFFSINEYKKISQYTRCSRVSGSISIYDCFFEMLIL